MSLGAPEILLILGIILLLFGAKRLPELARSFGKSTKEFRKGLQDGTDDEESTAKKTAAKKPDED